MPPSSPSRRLQVRSSILPFQPRGVGVGDTLVAFPEAGAYRRVLQRWLGRDSLATFRVLELSSYHAIVACVTAGAGIALMPESVLEVIPQAKVRRHVIPKAQSGITTPL